MRPTLILLLAAIAMASVTGAARAQVATATVTTTANGGGSATIAPGGTVAIAVRIAHNRVAVANFQGGSIITGNAGVGNNFSTLIGVGPTVNLGSFIGGSRVGADIATLPPLFPGGPPFPPPFGQNPMPVWQYEITGLLPGVYTINWVAPATWPSVNLYASNSAASFIEAQTTYVGATITVTPGVGTLGVAGLAGVVAGRRRGRG